MRFFRFTHRNPWAGLLLFVVPLLLCGCIKDPLPPYGEVTILLSTDMSVPESFDALVLERNKDERWVFTTKATAEGLKGGPCDLSNPEHSGLVFPSTVVLRSNRDEPVTLDLTLKACKGSALVFERSFAVEMPGPGEQRMVRAPILWLCADWENRCFGCNETPGSVEQQCFHKHIAQLQTSAPCQTSACTDDSNLFFRELEFQPLEVASYEATSRPEHGCFDARQPFAASNESVTSVPANWQILPTDPGRRFCQATIDEAWIHDPRLNLALVLPPGDLGACDPSRCLIALEAFTPTGWARDLPGSEALISRDAIVLPDAVCHLLDSGQVLEVLASLGRSQKGFTTPFCSINNDTILPNNKPPADGTRYTFDDQNTWSPADRALPILRTGASTFADVFSKVAVSGNGAGRFTNQQFAYSEAQLLRPPFTLAAWVSLTELVPGTDAGATPPMPIVSDIDQSCSTGVRLQLRSNADRSKVLLELGIPTGTVPGSDHLCQLHWSCASFASKSFTGGYFTPWNPGVWRHVAVIQSGTSPSSKSSTLYLDGIAAEELGTCTEASPIGPHDDARFYVGSSRAELGAAASHPILIDELAAYPYAFDVAKLQLLYLASATVPGPSGLRWGAWGGQGSHASVTSGSPLSVSVIDLPNGSAGTYANLAAPLDLDDADGGRLVRDLSGFDEAVIVADLPPNKPFQFSLLSDYGSRQCTWQLFSKPGPTNLRYSDAVIIDLRRPSWCIDPNCGFDLRNVERATLGSDWKDGEEIPKYSVRSLTFRKRKLAGASIERSTTIGGTWGPHGWCWRSVSYAPQWDVAPVNTGEGLISFPAPTATPFSSDKAPRDQQPEITADPSANPNLGARDLTPCASILIDADWDPASLATAWTATNDPDFALQDDRNRTATFTLPKPSGVVNVNLENGPNYIWPTPLPGEEEATYGDIRSSVTRISIRSDQAIAVGGIRCCDSAMNCQNLQ